LDGPFGAAAMIDGAGKLNVFLRIVLSISGLVIGTVAAYTFITSWIE